LNFPKRLKKNPQISNFTEICRVGNRVIPCGRTVRHEEANRRFSKFGKKKGLHIEKTRLFFFEMISCRVILTIVPTVHTANSQIPVVEEIVSLLAFWPRIIFLILAHPVYKM